MSVSHVGNWRNLYVNMIRVLLCGPPPSSKGGVTMWVQMVMEYINNHPSEEVEVELFPIERSASLTHLLPIHKRYYYAIKDYLRAYFSIDEKLKKSSYDVVHVLSSLGTGGIVRDWLFAKLAKSYGCDSIIHYHCGTMPKIMGHGGWQKKLVIKTIKTSRCAIVLDEASYQALLQQGIRNVVKIGNAYNPTIDDISKRGFKRFPDELLFVGHVVPEKGIYELLEATHDIPNIHVKCFGPENINYQNKLENYISTHPFLGTIEFFGLQAPEKIYEEMCKATLFVLPTYSEGFPLVIVEAMACGCPIVTTPVGAIPEMLGCEKECAGYLVPVKDASILRKQILECLDNKESIFKRAKMAQEKAQKKYSIEEVTKMLNEVWVNNRYNSKKH